MRGPRGPIWNSNYIQVAYATGTKIIGPTGEEFYDQDGHDILKSGKVVGSLLSLWDHDGKPRSVDGGADWLFPLQ